MGGKLVSHKFIKAYLQAPRNPPCPKCQAPTAKWGKKTSNIRIPQIPRHPSILRLSKTRYRCTSCKSTHTIETSLVHKNCFISKATKMCIMVDALEAIAEKTIAKDNDFSPSTVTRVLNPLLYERRTNTNTLPKNIIVEN